MRRDPDPIRRGRRATELLALYQQRSTELARLRREALEEAHRDLGLPYSQIATSLGITKGRVTQIRSTAPAAARALFGVGPVTVVTPYRYRVTDRERPLIAAEDVAGADAAKRLLEFFDFVTRSAQIGPDDAELPSGDLFIICGPKSSPAVTSLVDTDPRLTIANDDEGWFVEDRQTQARHRSPSDTTGESADVAYVARRVEGNRTITHVAGLHAIGSLGAVEYLTANAAELYSASAGKDFSLLVESGYDGLAITGTAAIGDPLWWEH